MKVLIFMCGEGLGHTSRCISVGRSLLSRGHDVSFGAYGYSRQLIEKTGYKAYEIPSEIKLVGSSGSLDMAESVEATLKNVKLLGGPIVLRLIDDIKPDVVLSDSYYLGTIAAKLKGIRTIIIVNQTNMEEFFKNRGVPLQILGKIAKSFYTTVFRNVDKILIPDYPPPYTVCARNITLRPAMVDKIEYVGPLVRKKYSETASIKLKKPHVLSTIGGFGYREKLLKNVIKAASIDEKINYTLVAGPSVKPEKITGKTGNVKIAPYIANPFPYIKSSDLVIAPGGHSTIMECMTYGKPLLSFPDMFHSEQENNADRITELGVGKRMSYFTPPQVILECIKQTLSDKTVKKNCSVMKKLSASLKGPARVVGLIEEA